MPISANNEFDYIVVGAGTAGCVVAARLTEDPDVRVLLLESGPADENPLIPIPLAWPGLWGSEVDYVPTDTRRSGWADSWLRVGGHEISGSADMTSPGHA